MKIVSQIQSVKVNLLNGLKFNAPVKLLGGLALGAILITSVALSSGTTPASPLSASSVSEAVINIDDLGGGIPDDEWMFNSPYHQDFSNGSSAEVRVTPSTVQGIPDDEWMLNSPFHQDFSAVGKLGVETEQANLFPKVEL